MRFLYLFCLLGILGINVNAQSVKRGAVKGKITSAVVQNETLEGAIISVINLQDSVVAGNAFSDKNGLYEIKGLALGKYKMAVSLYSFKTATHYFSITSEQPLYQMADIKLDSMSYSLKEVEVVAEAVPVRLKKDTVEFNASSFKTRENAVVEDLLKKLPGVEVQADGSLSAHGQKVTRILVNGKPFFGNDLKMATQNLPSNIVDKIQVIDRKTEREDADDNETDKVINITIRKDKRKGLFGKTSGGGGNDERHEANLNLNRFNDDQQISINTSSRNNLISNTLSAGLNFSDQLGPKLSFSGSYTFNQSKNENESLLKRNILIQEQSVYYLDQSEGQNKNTGHGLGLQLIYKFDPSSNLTISPSLNFQENRSQSANRFESTNSMMEKINDGNRSTEMLSRSPNITNSLSYEKKFAEKGRALELTINNKFDETDGSNLNSSFSAFYQNEPVQNSFDQQKLNDNSSQNHNISLNYTEPIPKLKGKLIEFSYQYGNRIENSSANTFDYNELTDAYDQQNELLSNVYRNHTISNKYGIRLKSKTSNINYSVGLSLRQNDLRGKSITKDSLYRQQTLSIVPSALFDYKVSKTARLNISYTGNLRQPDIKDLQPVPDNSNPLYIRLGNPNLSPEFSNSLNLRYNSYITGTYISINGTTTANKITYNSFFDVATGKQTSRPENVSGNYQIMGNVTFGIPINGMKSSLKPKLNATTSRNITFINGNKVSTYAHVLGTGLSLNYNWQEILELNLSSDFRYNQTNYDNPSLKNLNYVTANSSMKLSCYMPKNFVLSSSLGFNTNAGRVQNAKRNATMLDMGIYKEFLKNKKARITLQGFDLLNQSSSITRTVTDNTIEDRQTKVLKRYFLLTFSWQFNKFGS
ncbi:TonB-dependent receptor family protein [Solitalea sp. MAHUQ-68]|uniref:TonB-dependent receptor family protein n=1 Tax=Solitalea agri TaxID=2953739 RepID=A0A9X2JAL7_9SPHI|nr:TonB-dependent receptor [Solitalea agri]MCO4291562.1 TonB-dependent receptor family protein [Solitalea agri]